MLSINTFLVDFKIITHKSCIGKNGKNIDLFLLFVLVFEDA